MKPADSGAFLKQENEEVHAKKQVHNTRSDKDAGESTLRIRRQQQTPVIAFFATLASHSEHTGVHQAIAFDTVVTNIGGAYNPHFGAFVAPVSGVYVFSTTILGYDNDNLHCVIMRNGNMVARLSMRDRAAMYVSASATVILHLNKGDDVDVQNEDYTDTWIYGDHYSMLSGFLLHED